MLGIPWIDLDHAIQTESGRSIAEIFDAYGESGFRDLESRSLKKAVIDPPHVISLGGGAILSSENRDLIKNSGRCVWLTASPETIAGRIAGDVVTTAQRPALTKLASLDEIRHLLNVREPFYREVAELTINTENQTSQEIAEQIVAWLGPRLAP